MFFLDSLTLMSLWRIVVFLLLMHFGCCLFDRPLNVHFETKYDNNHNEIKQLLSDHKRFDTTNWTHYALLAIILGLVVVMVRSLYRCCRPIILAYTTLTTAHEQRPTNTPREYSPPYPSLILQHAPDQPRLNNPPNAPPRIVS